jgi:hypothetical protein
MCEDWQALDVRGVYVLCVIFVVEIHARRSDFEAGTCENCTVWDVCE